MNRKTIDKQRRKTLFTSLASLGKIAKLTLDSNCTRLWMAEGESALYSVYASSPSAAEAALRALRVILTWQTTTLGFVTSSRPSN